MLVNNKTNNYIEKQEMITELTEIKERLRMVSRYVTSRGKLNMGNILVRNQLSIEEYEQALYDIKYKFKPTNRRELRKAGFYPVDENNYFANLDNDCEMEGHIRSYVDGAEIKHITFTFNLYTDLYLREINDVFLFAMVSPFFEAVKEVFGLHNITKPEFLPMRSCKESDESNKLTMKDFIECRANFVIFGTDQKGKIMMLILQNVTHKDESCSTVEVNLVSFNEDGVEE